MKNDEEFRNEVKTRYGFSDWSGRVRGKPDTVRMDVQLPETIIDAWALERREAVSEGLKGVDVAYRYLYSRPEVKGRERILIRLREYESALAAHEGLIDIVMTCMAPVLPPCKSVATDAGDVCFGSHGETQTSAVFARYNVLVQVESIGAEQTAVTPFVKAIDRLLAGDVPPK